MGTWRVITLSYCLCLKSPPPKRFKNLYLHKKPLKTSVLNHRREVNYTMFKYRHLKDHKNYRRFWTPPPAQKVLRLSQWYLRASPNLKTSNQPLQISYESITRKFVFERLHFLIFYLVLQNSYFIDSKTHIFSNSSTSELGESFNRWFLTTAVCRSQPQYGSPWQQCGLGGHTNSTD